MSTAVFPVLFEAALRALAAAVVVWSALRLLRVRNVRTQKTAWSLMLLGALAMPLLMRCDLLPAGDAVNLRSFSPAVESVLSSLRGAVLSDRFPIPAESAPAPPPFAWNERSIAHPSVTEKISGGAGYTEPSFDDSLATPRYAITSARFLDESKAQYSANVSSPTRAARLFALAWGLYLPVAAALLFRLVSGLISGFRLWMTADPVLSPLLADLSLSGLVRCSPHVSSPANIGSGILLPIDYRKWSAEKLRAVLAHERAHVRQRDFHLQLLAGFYAALVWFSPLGWWLKHKLSELGEAIGDRAGLEEAASPSSYARMLLEFAALSRPAHTGVAMARTHHLSSRIERLLNDSSFHQAFTGGSRRAILALAIAPLTLLASAALIRVQGAAQTMAPAQQSGNAQVLQSAQDSRGSNPPAQTTTNQDQQQPAPAPAPPPSNPAEAPQPASPPPGAETPAPAPQAAPAPEATPEPLAPSPAVVPPVPPILVKVPPMPPIDVHIPPMPDINVEVSKAMLQMDEMGKNFYFFRNSPFVIYDGGDPWALVPAQGEATTNIPYAGQYRTGDRAEIDAARKTAPAPFFWFKHEGKSYIVDDASVVAQIQSLEKPVQDLRNHMFALEKQQRDLGQQLRQQVRKQRLTSIPKPDLSKQMADLNAAVDSLKSSQGDTITRDQLMNLQRQIAALQSHLYASESGMHKQNGEWGTEMGAFGKQMGELGAEQGRLAGEMARISRANREKISSIIEQSLKDGKARPVQ
jgi:beta-lactamase regulating signal transducer with metallopeptidase domain/predicted  nucleic acid-binding Zn-ribbon protein